MKTLPEPTTNVQHPALPITAEHAPRWQGLLQKALERRLTLQSVDRYVTHEGRHLVIETLVYAVGSYSQPGLTHQVEITRQGVPLPGNGFAATYPLTTRCDCFAGSVPMGCTHAALAIETAGWWPFPIHAQTSMEADDGLAVDPEQPLQPARYAVGQAVKLAWQQRRTFWVHDATFDGTGWRYQLADEARRVVLEADEHKVRPATSKRSVAA